MKEQLKRNLTPAITITLINFYVLGRVIAKDDWVHGLGYFLFFHAAVFLIYRFTLPPLPENPNPVKQPKQELLVTLTLMVVGLAAIFANFYMRSTGETYIPLIRLPVIFLMMLCTFPVALALYLLFKRYKLPQLGLRVKPWKILLLGFLIWALTGIFSGIFNYEGWLWKMAYEEMGLTGLIVQGLIGAAVVEEFSRFVLQTRLNQFIRNPFTCIIIASIVWTAYHIPITYFKTESAFSTFNYCMQIIPLGFIWGYLTYKTKSFLPAVIAHGLNLWGFQNG